MPDIVTVKIKEKIILPELYFRKYLHWKNSNKIQMLNWLKLLYIQLYKM